MSSSETSFTEIHARIAHAAAQHGQSARLLAVSKTKPADAVRRLAGLGQRAFGENYVQEGVRKRGELGDLEDLRLVLIGPLQSNKARAAAEACDCVETIDRLKIAERLSAARSPERAATA